MARAAQESTPEPTYRRAICDRCHGRKDDCIWVRPADAPADQPDDEWCLCGDCRERCQDRGVSIVNIDADYPWVFVG